MHSQLQVYAESLLNPDLKETGSRSFAILNSSYYQKNLRWQHPSPTCLIRIMLSLFWEMGRFWWGRHLGILKPIAVTCLIMSALLLAKITLNPQIMASPRKFLTQIAALYDSSGTSLDARFPTLIVRYWNMAESSCCSDCLCSRAPPPSWYRWGLIFVKQVLGKTTCNPATFAGLQHCD